MRLHFLCYHIYVYVYISQTQEFVIICRKKTDLFELKSFHWLDRRLMFELLIDL